MKPEQANKGRRYDPIPREGQVGIDFEPIELFEKREMAARTHKYPFEVGFWTGIGLGRDLLVARAKIEYRDILPNTLLYLFVKSLNDLLAAVSVSKSGYPFQSWPLIRGGFEAAELMDYLYRHPEDCEKWINKERRFDGLSWLRNELPESELRRKLYDTVNELSHANLRPIDAFSTLRLNESGTRYLIVGPNPYPVQGHHPANIGSNLISYAIRVLWQSDRGVMGSNWVARFHSFDAEFKFAFGEAWESILDQPQR